MKTHISSTGLCCGLGLMVSLATGASSQLEKSGPIRCAGDETLTITNRHIEADGTGIEASGNCEIVLEDSEVVAGGVGILTHDHAAVRIEDSRITGKSDGIRATGESRVTYKNSVITGGVSTEDDASAKDAGGSLVR